MESLIDIRGLGLSFKRDGQTTRVLEGLDLTIAPGSLVAVVGASGVGKSTLLRVLMGLVPATTGVVRTAVANGSHPLLALVFQDARLLPWRTVIDNVAFGLEGHGLNKADRHRRAREALQIVGLADLANRWPHQLSGGQRQRVALARALAVEPQGLLMDEPFAALDALTRENLQDELLRIRAVTDKTILFVTHDLDEALYLADRLVVLAGSPGRKVADVTLDAPRPRRRGDGADARLVDDIRRLLGGGTAADSATVSSAALTVAA